MLQMIILHAAMLLIWVHELMKRGWRVGIFLWLDALTNNAEVETKAAVTSMMFVCL